MTDGFLGMNGPSGEPGEVSLANVCNNLQTDDVIVYSVVFGVVSQPELRDCSGVDRYYQVNSASQLIGAYDEIAGKLKTVRINR